MKTVQRLLQKDASAKVTCALKATILDEWSSVFIEECSRLPTLTPDTCGCNTTLCTPGQACNYSTSTCHDIPPCPPSPHPAPYPGCYCNYSTTVCTPGEMCNQRDSSCSEPAICQDPTTLDIWETLNLTHPILDMSRSARDGDTINLKCKENYFLIQNLV